MLSANKLQHMCDELTFVATVFVDFAKILKLACDEERGVEELKALIKHLTKTDVSFDDVKSAWINYSVVTLLLICNKGDESVLFELTPDASNNTYVVRVG